MKTKTTQTLLAVAFSTGLLSVSGNAAAVLYSAETQITGQADSWATDVDTLNQFMSRQNASPVVASNSNYPVAVTGSTLAYTYADAWSLVQTAGIHLNAWSSSTVSGGDTYSYSAAYASGSFSDQFALSSPFAATGSSGFATVAFSVSGSLRDTFWGPSVTGNNYLWGRSSEEWRAGFQLRNTANQGLAWEGFQRQSMTNGASDLMGNAVPGTFFFTMPVVFGQALNLSIYGTVQAFSSTQNSYGQTNVSGVDAMGEASFGNTIAWGGIVDLRDANGVAITDFNALSADTGFNYANAYVAAVPVPAAVWLFGSGLLGLVGVARRGRRSPEHTATGVASF